jgi:hypothetical protein
MKLIDLEMIIRALCGLEILTTGDNINRKPLMIKGVTVGLSSLSPSEVFVDIPRNQNGQSLPFGPPLQTPRHPYRHAMLPNPNLNRNRDRVGGRPMVPNTFAEKRTYIPRGQPYPRPGYSQVPPSWGTKPANPFPSPPPAAPIDYSDYRAGSSAPNYYGPPSIPLQSPRNLPSTPLQPPAPEVVGEPQVPATYPKSPPQLTPIGSARHLSTSLTAPQSLAAESIKEEAPPVPAPPKAKPQPLIQVVSDPNLTLESSQPLTVVSATPKHPHVMPSVKLPHRPTHVHLGHNTPTEASNRLIEQVVVPSITATAPLPLTVAVAVGIHGEETASLTNLPAPPCLEGPTESSGSVSSLGRRPRVAWGQGLRRKTSIESEVPPTPSVKADQPDSVHAEMELFPSDPPLESVLDLEEDALSPEQEEVPAAQEEVRMALEEVPSEKVAIECQSKDVAPPESADTLRVTIPLMPPVLPQSPRLLSAESPRSKPKAGPARPPPPEEIKSAKKQDKKPKKIVAGLTYPPHARLSFSLSPEPKPGGIARKKSFDETNDSDSDGAKPEDGKKRRSSSRGNLMSAADSDKESGEDEAPRKKRGRPPAGAFRSGPSSPPADDYEKESQQQKGAKAKNGRGVRSGKGKSESEHMAPYQSFPPPPVKRRSRSFGSFERDSLGGLFSSVSDLRNAYYALQGMVRIQVGMRGVSGFNKEDLMGLNQMLQNPQSVVNLPIPYTSEIVMCLEIIEAKSYQYGDAMVAIQLLKREIEELLRRGHHPQDSEPCTVRPPAESLNGTCEASEALQMSPYASSPMGLVKKSMIKSEAPPPPRKSTLWPEPLVPQFLAENMKKASTAEVCAHVHFPPTLPNAGNIYSLDSLVSRGKTELERKRPIVLAEVRRRKLASTQAWEILADRYLAVKHRWEHYQEKNAVVPPGEEEVLGPRLRAMSAMRNILGPRAPARLSTMRASSELLAPDQDKVMQQLAMKELMARRLAFGTCPIPDMLSPWQHSDSCVPPKPPSWPPKDVYFPKIAAEERYSCPAEEFPKFIGDSPVIIDINGCRLTTDGRRPLCAVQPTGQPCPLNCNCALQVDREERKCRPWSDMEKSVFLDKFMQFPKNFSKIAAFLTDRSTKDCIKFYYDSKTSIPYKSLLREFDNRKRHLRNSWTHSCAAAVSVGGLLYPPAPDEKEHIAELPLDDVTYNTFGCHPLYMATALGLDGDADGDKGAFRKKQMAALQHRPPRERTEALSLRKDLKRDCLKLYGGKGLLTAAPSYADADGSGARKTFTYPADIRKVAAEPGLTEHFGGYGQLDGFCPQLADGPANSRHRKQKEPSSAATKDGASLKEIESALARGRGRGRRGRRPNTIPKGAVKSQEGPPSDEKLSPLARGRGRGRGGRLSGRGGRGRGKGRSEDDQTLAEKGDSENEAAFEGMENGLDDESFDQTAEEAEYEGGEEEEDDEFEEIRDQDQRAEDQEQEAEQQEIESSLEGEAEPCLVQCEDDLHSNGGPWPSTDTVDREQAVSEVVSSLLETVCDLSAKAPQVVSVESEPPHHCDSDQSVDPLLMDLQTSLHEEASESNEKRKFSEVSCAALPEEDGQSPVLPQAKYQKSELELSVDLVGESDSAVNK